MNCSTQPLTYTLHTFAYRSKISNVEFNTPKISQNEIDELEEECNRKIMEHRDITVHLMTKVEAMELEEVKTRGLPEDVIDAIRVIEIQGNS